MFHQELLPRKHALNDLIFADELRCVFFALAYALI